MTLAGPDAVADPLMFAVVYQKRMGADGAAFWAPVSGDPLSGWTVAGDSSWASVLAAARANPCLFRLASSGAWQTEVADLPGSIQNYYYICRDEDEAQYTIAYYYSTARSLSTATEANTWRIDSSPADGQDQFALRRAFSMALYVTNIKNQLVVQKVDDLGAPVSGAVFSLYRAQDVEVAADGTGAPRSGALPLDSLTTGPTAALPALEGGGVFPTGGNALPQGEYILLETFAPAGYQRSRQAVRVVVDGTGVYAHAGSAGDGVTVLRGVGSVMRSMVQYAAPDDVDVTLANIKAALARDVALTPDGFVWQEADWSESGQSPVLHLQFHSGSPLLDYGLAAGGGTASLDQLTLAIDAGWSRLLVRQCLEHVDPGDATPRTDLGDRDLTPLFSGSVVVRVSNRRVGSLRVEKQVEGAAGETERDFHFTVQLGDPSVEGLHGQMEFEGGQARFVLSHGESLTAEGLPAGAAYTVTEAEANTEGYSSTAAAASGEVPHGSAASVTFVNRREAVPSPSPSPSPGPAPSPAPTGATSCPPSASPAPVPGGLPLTGDGAGRALLGAALGLAALSGCLALWAAKGKGR